VSQSTVQLDSRRHCEEPNSFFCRASLLLMVVVLVQCAGIRAQSTEGQTIIVKDASQLPQHVYRINGSLKDLLASQAGFTLLADQVRTDIEADLKIHEIRDKSEVRRLLAVLASIYLLSDRDDLAMSAVLRVRELQSNEVDRLVSGIAMEAVLVARSVSTPGTEVYREAYRRELSNRLSALPYPMMIDNIEELRKDTDIYTRNVIQAIVDQSLQPLVTATGEIGSDVAQQVMTVVTCLISNSSERCFQRGVSNQSRQQQRQATERVLCLHGHKPAA